MTCTFFGHSWTPFSVKPLLYETLIRLIEDCNITRFYVGTHGDFDAMVRVCLKELVDQYPIKFYVVLAYLPTRKAPHGAEPSKYSILPEGIENVPPRFAISWRNKWMIRQSDYVITYVTHPHGGAAQFKALAERQGKTVINLADIHSP